MCSLPHAPFDTTPWIQWEWYGFAKSPDFEYFIMHLKPTPNDRKYLHWIFNTDGYSLFRSMTMYFKPNRMRKKYARIRCERRKHIQNIFTGQMQTERLPPETLKMLIASITWKECLLGFQQISKFTQELPNEIRKYKCKTDHQIRIEQIFFVAIQSKMNKTFNFLWFSFWTYCYFLVNNFCSEFLLLNTFKLDFMFKRVLIRGDRTNWLNKHSFIRPKYCAHSKVSNCDFPKT